MPNGTPLTLPAVTSLMLMEVFKVALQAL